MLATKHMYAPMVVCGPLQCDKMVHGLLAGRTLTLAIADSLHPVLSGSEGSVQTRSDGVYGAM